MITEADLAHWCRVVPWSTDEQVAGGVGDVLDALQEVADAVGFDRVQATIGRHPKARFNSTLVD